MNSFTVPIAKATGGILMIRPKLVVVGNDRDEQPRSFQDGRRFLFEMSGIKLIFCSFSLVLCLCFMFILGVFVGRGSPVVRSDDFSMKGRFLRLLGLDAQIGRPCPGAAATWVDPETMLKSLNYYEDLAQTHKNGATAAAAPRVNESASPPAFEPAAKDSSKRAPASRQPAEKQPAPQQGKPQQFEIADSRFTLLVASLKEADAQALVAKLKGQGYSPVVESIDLGTVKWNRILLGSFPTREAAISFADEFNAKEKLKALVMGSPD